MRQFLFDSPVPDYMNGYFLSCVCVFGVRGCVTSCLEKKHVLGILTFLMLLNAGSLYKYPLAFLP